MKKRAMGLLMTAIMLVYAGAGASGWIPGMWGEATATPTPAVFSFRGGVQWDMSTEQVRGMEDLDLMERSRDGWSILYPAEQVHVSRYTADLVYMFFNDSLKMITYDFGSGGTATDYAYLTGALDEVYGDHSTLEASAVVRYMDQIYPGYYSPERLTQVLGWTGGTDTAVFLYYYAENAYAILYVNSVAASQGGYVTDGL